MIAFTVLLSSGTEPSSEDEVDPGMVRREVNQSRDKNSRLSLYHTTGDRRLVVAAGNKLSKKRIAFIEEKGGCGADEDESDEESVHWRLRAYSRQSPEGCERAGHEAKLRWQILEEN